MYDIIPSETDEQYKMNVISDRWERRPAMNEIRGKAKHVGAVPKLWKNLSNSG